METNGNQCKPKPQCNWPMETNGNQNPTVIGKWKPMETKNPMELANGNQNPNGIYMGNGNQNPN